MEERSTKPIFTANAAELTLPANVRRDNKILLKFNLALINSVCLGLAITLVIGYLVISNQVVSKGFTINSLKNNIAELSKTNKNLELTAMNLESYAAINERVTKLGLVTANDVEYLEITRGEVAMR
ncbi:MAG: hypothetical protein AAB956_01585 [Patescibacteria group bacterium]